jgi:hypothetical protein
MKSRRQEVKRKGQPNSRTNAEAKPSGSVRRRLYFSCNGFWGPEALAPARWDLPIICAAYLSAQADLYVSLFTDLHVGMSILFARFLTIFASNLA